MHTAIDNNRSIADIASPKIRASTDEIQTANGPSASASAKQNNAQGKND